MYTMPVCTNREKPFYLYEMQLFYKNILTFVSFDCDDAITHFTPVKKEQQLTIKLGNVVTFVHI